MFNNIIQYILSLGAAIFLPVIMIILGLSFKMKLKKAIMSGMTLGVAFTGMSVILGFMFSTISPVAEAFVKSTGIEFNIIDVGWTPMSAISWAWPYALLMFPVQLGINFLMIVLKQTNVLNVDLWNVWGKIFVATMVASVSNNILLGFLAAVIQIILELKTGEIIQKKTQKLTGIPGITCTHYMVMQGAIMNPINKLIDLIPGIKDINLDSKKLKEKIGVFGENSVVGFIMGAFLAIFAQYSVQQTLDVAIKVATSLVLFPMVAKLFMEALAPIADAASTFMKSKFKDREIYIGLDWPFLAGQAEIWVVAILMIPISIVLAVIFAKLGWSNVLPLAGIVNVCVAVPAYILTGGNILRMLILGIVFTPSYLIVSSQLAPYITDLAIKTKTLELSSSQMVTYFGVEAPELRWVLTYGLSGKIQGIIGLIIFAILFVWYYKTMKKYNENN